MTATLYGIISYWSGVFAILCVIVWIYYKKEKTMPKNDVHFYMTIDPELHFHELWLGKPILKNGTWKPNPNNPCINITNLLRHTEPKYKNDVKINCGGIEEVFLILDKKITLDINNVKKIINKK